MPQRSRFDGRPASTLKLNGGRLCLDFVNSVGARHFSHSGEMTVRDEKLNDYIDLLAWGRHAGALTDDEAESLAKESNRRPREAAAVFGRAIQLREAIYRICKARLSRREPKKTDLSTLNKELCQERNVEQLVFEKAGFKWQWSARSAELERVLWSVTKSTAELLTRGDLSRVRECDGEDCGWIFLDVSKNRGRRWCDMQDCGNLAKVRRFRRRLRGAN
jgi:predicted RNA-binding Zn ribbon-like protein